MRHHREAQGYVTLPLTSLCVKILGRSSAPTHSSSTSGTLLLHCVGCPHNNVPPQPQLLLPNVFTARCWHKLPIRSQYTLPAVPGTILLSVVDPRPTLRLITLGSSLHCHVSHGSLCSGLVCSVLLAMALYIQSLSPRWRQSHDATVSNEGYFLYTSTRSKHLFLSEGSLWNFGIIFYIMFLHPKYWSCLWMV